VSDIIAAPLCAWYVDQLAHKKVPWFLGIVLITVGTILFGVGNSFPLLLVSRLLQGASSGILYTVGLAVLVDSVDRDEIGRWMGTAMSCNNIGIIIAPLIGGVVYDRAGKMAVFAIMISLGGIDIVLRLLMNEKPKVEVTEIFQVDEKGSEIQPPVCPPAAPMSRFPGIMQLLRSPRFLAALYGCFINEFIVSSLLATLPLFAFHTFNWTSLQSGLLFLTIAIPALAGPLAGWLADRFGPRSVALIGFVLTSPPLLLLRLVSQNSPQHMAMLCGLLTLAGCTVIFFLSPLGADVSYVAEAVGLERYGAQDALYASSFSLVNTSLALAGLVGPIAAGAIQDRFGWEGTTILLGVICFTGAVPCVSLPSFFLFRGQKILEGFLTCFIRLCSLAGNLPTVPSDLLVMILPLLPEVIFLRCYIFRCCFFPFPSLHMLGSIFCTA